MMRVEEMDGIYVGDLDAAERKALDEAVERGEARIVYEGVGGFMGLGKVRLVRRG